MISYQASVSKGWLHKNGGFEFNSQYYLDPLYRLEQDKKMNCFVRDTFDKYPVYNMEANLMQAGFVNDNQVLIGGIQPNLILGLILGADFVFYPDKDMDVSGNPLKNISNRKELPEIKKILNHPFIKEMEDQISFLQKEHPEVDIIPPFFWDSSGRATIHGIITTSFKLIGDNAMLMIIMSPDLLHAVHQWIAEVYILLINYFAQLTNIQVRSVHVGECSGAMISNDQYGEFVNPYINKIGRRFNKIRLHSCGLSDHVLKSITKIENLHEIDTGSNTSIAKIRKTRGRDFKISIEPPVKLMLKNSSEEELMIWLDNALKENIGGPLNFVLHLESGYSTKNCLMIYDELKRRMLIN